MHVVDLPYERYGEATLSQAAQPPSGFAAAPAGAFMRDHREEFVPLPRPGCTVLAEPYPLTAVSSTLVGLQESLRDNCPEFAAVPVETLHMTVADVLSGDSYDDLSELERQTLCRRVASILETARLPEHAAGTIRGIATFPSTIVTIIDFDRTTYQGLVATRQTIYGELGLSRKYPFTGHVTLGYVEIPPYAATTVRHRAEHAVDVARETLGVIRSGGGPITFCIERAAAFTFPDMSRFDKIIVA